VEGETGSCIETCVTCDFGRTEVVSIKIEDAIDIKDEFAEAVSVPSIKTEHEVRFLGVCVCDVMWQIMLLGHLFPKKEIVNLSFTIYCFVLYCGCHIPFEI